MVPGFSDSTCNCHTRLGLTSMEEFELKVLCNHLVDEVELYPQMFDTEMAMFKMRLYQMSFGVSAMPWKSPDCFIFCRCRLLGQMQLPEGHWCSVCWFKRVSMGDSDMALCACCLGFLSSVSLIIYSHPKHSLAQLFVHGWDKKWNLQNSLHMSNITKSRCQSPSSAREAGVWLSWPADPSATHWALKNCRKEYDQSCAERILPLISGCLGSNCSWQQRFQPMPLKARTFMQTNKESWALALRVFMLAAAVVPSAS